eukprot:302581_1
MISRSQRALFAFAATPGTLGFSGLHAIQQASRTSVFALRMSTSASSPTDGGVAFYVPDLPYSYSALEPHLDTATMKLHHLFHHKAYVTNANKAFSGKAAPPILKVQKEAKKQGINNACGGHYNHAFFWTTLCPAEESGKPSASLSQAIDSSFGDIEAMKDKFNAAAAGVFGSGWAWLGVTSEGKLDITSTPNQDNPLMDTAGCTSMIPILGLDVWEHAYYLKYQNRRPEYISSFWNVVNWQKVSEYYEQYAIKQTGVPVKG